MSVLVDSDILIDVLRGRDQRILARWIEQREASAIVLCSPVSVAELWHGARAQEHQALEGLFRALICIPIDADTDRRAGDFLRAYHKSHSVELADALIAAAAQQQNAILWTRNRKHYPMRDLIFF